MKFLRALLYKIGYLAFLRFKFWELWKEYNFIKINQYNSIKQNLSLQKRRLFELLNFAINNIPYYQKIAKERNIKISEKKVFKDIKQFPILTKDIIRNNWESLHLNLSNKKRYILATSGGTTGEPIIILQDLNFRIKNEAAQLVFDEIGGYYMGDKLLMLWGNENDIIKETRDVFHHFILKYIKNTYFQNSFKMSDEIIHRYLQENKAIKPKVMLAYVQSAYEVAKYIERKNLKIQNFNSIITSAGVLTKKVKEYLEKIFKCKVFNRYATREIGKLATSCEESDKLHINMYQQFVEILDQNDREVEEHKKGKIIITNLIGFAMPLIRYEIGDMGSIDLSQCPCGRGLIRLDMVYGRIVDIFKNEKGELIDGEYFTHLFYFLENIKKFQIIQEKLDFININIVTIDNNKLNNSIEEDLCKKIKIVMGTNCQIKFNYVYDIDPHSSGKFRYTISKVL